MTHKQQRLQCFAVKDFDGVLTFLRIGSRNMFLYDTVLFHQITGQVSQK